MKTSIYEILGAASFIFGLFFMISSFSGITGFVILSGIGKRTSSILGVIFIVGVIVLFMTGRKTGSKLEEVKYSFP